MQINMKNRIRLGEILKEEFMNPLELNAEDLSEKVKIPLNTVLGILKGEEVVSKGVAEKLSEFFKTSIEFWMNLEGLKLNEKDAKTFFESLNNPSEPNAALIKAKESAKRLIKRR